MGWFNKKSKEKLISAQFNGHSHSGNEKKISSFSLDPSTYKNDVTFNRGQNSFRKSVNRNRNSKLNRNKELKGKKRLEEPGEKPFGLNVNYMIFESLPTKRASMVSLNSLVLGDSSIYNKEPFDVEDSLLQKEESDFKSDLIQNVKFKDPVLMLENTTDKAKPNGEVIKKHPGTTKGGGIRYRETGFKSKAAYKNVRSRRQGNRETQQVTQNVKTIKSRISDRQKKSRPVSSRFSTLQNLGKSSSESNLHELQSSGMSRSALSLPDFYQQDLVKEIHLNENDPKKFAIVLDVSGFSLNEIVIALKEGNLIVNAKHFFKTEYGFEFFQLHRNYPLPVGVQKSEIFTKINKNGMLEIKYSPENIATMTGQEFRFIGADTYEMFVDCQQHSLKDIKIRFENEITLVVYEEIHQQSTEKNVNGFERIIGKYTVPPDADRNTITTGIKGDALQILLKRKV